MSPCMDGLTVRPYEQLRNSNDTQSTTTGNMTPAAAIHIQGARFAYTPGHPILSIDELSIPSGRRIFVHGPSGSGKTTLLSLISGVLVPQQGTVNVLGQHLTRLSASARDTLRG